MDDNRMSQAGAQQRVDQIYAFQQEISELENHNILSVSPEEKDRIRQFHHELLQNLAKIYDVDTSQKSRQFTLGMKIASLFGALTISISIFFVFFQFWGLISTPIQVFVLISAPILLFGLSLHLSQAEKNSYYSKISALVALACFVLNVSMLGLIFNIAPSPNAFFIWAAFSFTLAYACNARLLIFFGIVSLTGFIAMRVGSWGGMYWISFGERPENFFLPSLIIFLIPQFIDHKHFFGFESIYRVMALVLIFLPLLILSNWGEASYLSWPNNVIEGFYQVVGFFLSAAAIYAGIRCQWRDVMNTGNVFFILFLYTKLFDWWWDWMPKYIFFLVLGLSALLALAVLKRVRKSYLHEALAK